MPTKAELEEKIAGLEAQIANFESTSTEGVPPEPPRYNIQIGVKRNDYNYGFVEVNFGASGVTDTNKDIVIDEANNIFEALFMKFVGKVEAAVEGGRFNYEGGVEIPPPLESPYADERSSGYVPPRVEASVNITPASAPFEPEDVPETPPWLSGKSVFGSDEFDEEDSEMAPFDLPDWAGGDLPEVSGGDFKL